MVQNRLLNEDCSDSGALPEVTDDMIRLVPTTKADG